MERCAGVIVYKKVNDNYEILLCHPGGPYLTDKNVWGIPKGHIESGENTLVAAYRELQEETGLNCEITDLNYVGEYKQNSKKRITVYDLNSDFDIATFTSNTTLIEYPPKSSQTITIQENDAAKWFQFKDALQVIFKGQQKILIDWGEKHA